MKDFIKFRQFLRTKNLSVNEQYLLEYLFELHNSQYGYSYPAFKDLLLAFNTTSKNRINSIIKTLESKGLITVDRTNKNNRYKVVGIENFIITKEKKVVATERKENDEQSIQNKHGLNDLEMVDVEFISNELNINLNQALVLYLKSNKDIKRVLECFEQCKDRKVYKLVPYILSMLKNFTPTKVIKKVKELACRNFEERIYDYDSLESQLLAHY